jgi:rhodanese-related sulfurtransferase
MKKITREVLKNMMDTNVDFVLIDARGHEAYDKEHLPGAVSIPSDHLGEHLLKNYKKDRTIVTYCSSFECTASTIAAEKLEKYGFKKILEFKGGLADWKVAGYPTEK